MNPRRVAFVCADPGVPIFGTKGCSIHAQEILRGLQRRGVVVDVFARRAEGSPPADLASLRVYRLPRPESTDPAVRERQLQAANEGMREALRDAGPYDFVYERHALWSDAAMRHAAEAGIPGLLEVNAPLVEEQSQHRALSDRAAAEATAQSAFRHATALLAVSEEVAAYLRTTVDDPDKVHVVPNGVDPARFDAGRTGSTAHTNPADCVVGFVGTLKPWHGVEHLVRAFARARQEVAACRLILIGDGPERARLEAQVEAEGLAGSVVFTGAVAPETIPGWLAQLDVAVAPYPALANFYFSPLKVYEYMAARLPVVASRIGQLDRLLQHDRNGWLVPPGDVTALAEALVTLAKDPARRTRLGAEARTTIVRHHTWDQVVDRLLHLADASRPPRTRDPRRAMVTTEELA